MLPVSSCVVARLGDGLFSGEKDLIVVDSRVELGVDFVDRICGGVVRHFAVLTLVVASGL
jgi:hypothetical protein